MKISSSPAVGNIYCIWLRYLHSKEGKGEEGKEKKYRLLGADSQP